MDDDTPQPLHVASVVRLPKGTSDRKSAVLAARAMGYLAIRLQFHGAPVAGLKVKFHRINDVDDDAPAAMDPERISADDGVAFFPRLVPAGHYGVEVEHQPATVVPTVGDINAPYPVVLPIGRPLVDEADYEEFVFRPY
jgi:hypothetical protein